MIYVTTLAAAKKLRYDIGSAMHPKGEPYVRGRCAAQVLGWSGWHFHQCFKRNGHGPAKLYCHIHANQIVKRQAIDRYWREKFKQAR